MRFTYVFCCATAAYLLLKRKKKEASLRIIHSNNKIALIFKLITDKFFQDFSPSPLFSSGHSQTILVSLITSLIALVKRFFSFYCYKYKREIFLLKDKGIIAVDTAVPKTVKRSFYDPETILLIVPGYTSSSKDYYIRSLVDDFANEFDCRVVNMRGCGGVELTNSKMLGITNDEDIAEVVASVAMQNPSKKIFLIGYSFGGMLVVRYLARFKNTLPSSIKGAVSICYPSNWEIATDYTEKMLYGIYTRSLANNIRNVFNQNVDGVFSENTLKENPEFYREKTEIVRRMDEMVHAGEFDQFYSWKSLKYDSFESYKRDFDLADKLSAISVPHLSIYTEDDPIVPVSEIKVKELKQNDNLITVISKSGGHLGFFSGLIPSRWIEKPIVTFIKTVELMSS